MLTVGSMSVLKSLIRLSVGVLAADHCEEDQRDEDLIGSRRATYKSIYPHVSTCWHAL